VGLFKKFKRAVRKAFVAAAVITAAVVLAVTFPMTAMFVAATVGTALITRSLMPKPPPVNRGYTVNSRGSAQDHQIIYGEVKVGGPIIYDEATGTDNRFFHRIIAVAGHEVNSFVTIYANDEALTIDSSGNVTSPSKYVGKMRVITRSGTSGQLAIPELVSDSAHWNNTCKLSGIAYIYCKFTFDADVYPNGVPVITSLVRGKKVYDPRTTNTTFSSNPALCLRDYLKSSYGLSEDDAKIDDSGFIVAANVCDQTVNNISGASPATSTRYTCNGAFTTASTPYDLLSDIVGSMGGKLWYGQGKWRVKPAYWTSPVMSLTEDDLRSSIGVSTRHSRRDNFNTLTGTFRGPESNWQVTDYPQVFNQEFLDADNGEELVADVPLAFTTSSLEASRLGLIALEGNRQQLTVSASFGLRTLSLGVGDNVTLTLPRFGWDNKEFEVFSWSFGLVGQDLQTQIILRETAESVFDQTYDGAFYERDNTTLPSPFYVPNVGITLSTALRNTNQTVVAVLDVDLSADSPFIDKYEVEYKLSSDSDFISLGTGSGTNYELIYTSDDNFDIRARAVNTLGVRGSYTTISNYGARPFANPPADVEQLSANVNQTTVVLSWNPVADLDLSHYEIRFTRDVPAVWSNSVLLIDKVARPATSVTTSSQSGTYLIKAVDKLGNKSVNAVGNTVAISASDTLSLNQIQTITENPNFSGTKTNTAIVDGNSLSLATGQSEGTYDFNSVFDLGATYTSYVESFIDIVQLNYVNLFDGPTENFDDREGLFDGDLAAYDGSTAVIQVATTLDNPSSGSAVFTDFNNLSAGSFLARGYKFRAVLSTNNLDVAPKLTRVQVKIDMPDIIQSANNIAFTGTANITYPSAFYSASNPAISTSVTNLTAGYHIEITNKSNSGFTISAKNSSGSLLGTQTELDYVAIGYGKET